MRVKLGGKNAVKYYFTFLSVVFVWSEMFEEKEFNFQVPTTDLALCYTKTNYDASTKGQPL